MATLRFTSSVPIVLPAFVLAVLRFVLLASVIGGPVRGPIDHRRKLAVWL